jgi:hypothetical protein
MSSDSKQSHDENSCLGKIVCLAAIPFGLMIERDPFGFTVRCPGESLILGGEFQLRLYQIRFLVRGHGFSPEKYWLVAVTTEIVLRLQSRTHPNT